MSLKTVFWSKSFALGNFESLAVEEKLDAIRHKIRANTPKRRKDRSKIKAARKQARKKS
jgi:hypothetical protein